jgi:hypothetical protein
LLSFLGIYFLDIMAVTDAIESGLISPIRGLKRVISDGYYANDYIIESPSNGSEGATFIPDQDGKLSSLP